MPSPSPLTPATREIGPASLLSAVFIGYMVGTYSVMGKGAQAIANLAGEYVGREIFAYAQSQGKTLYSLPALIDFLKANHFAEDISIGESAGSVFAQIGYCGICPKRVGMYEFDGTACPWGGILIGVLEPIMGKRFSVSAALTPGETCTIMLKVK